MQSFNPETETYDCIDDDDPLKILRLPFNLVMRMSGNKGKEGFKKGHPVMAIFPETTSFYRAVISKTPMWVLPNNNISEDDKISNATIPELIVKFMDDEDESGKTPHRRVPSRYAIPLPEKYFEGDVGVE